MNNQRPTNGATPIPDDAEALMALYALDALERDDREMLEAYLATDPAARSRVDQLFEAATLLWEPTALDDDLAGRLWEGILPRLGDSADGEVSTSTAIGEARPWRRSRHGGRAGQLTTRRDRPSRVTALAGFALAAAAVVSLIVVVVGRSASSTRTAEQQLVRTVDELRTRPGTKIASLTGSSSSGSVDVVVSPSGDLYVVAHGLADLGSDRTYQLWSIDAGRVVSLGLLGSHPGVVMLGTASPAKLAVTVERAGGSVKATTTPILVGEVH
jgi:anti-sigma-K factor RskA